MNRNNFDLLDCIREAARQKTILDVAREAVHNYMRENYGEHPKYLLLSPEVYYDMERALRLYNNISPCIDLATFMGVRLIVSPNVKKEELIIAVG